MTTVFWPNHYDTHANIWRILELSGMVTSVRKAHNYMRAGFVSVNGNSYYQIRDRIKIGAMYTFTLTFPNGKVQSMEFFLANQGPRPRKNNGSGPLTYYGKG